MKFMLPIMAVKNIDISRRFYEKVLQQKITLDLGENITFGNAFAIQANYLKLIGLNHLKIVPKSHDHELYFEEDNFDHFEKHLAKFEHIEYLHNTIEYPWGQRVIRFYDPDYHIIQVGENMGNVFRHFHRQGMSFEEIAARTMHPLGCVRKALAE